MKIRLLSEPRVILSNPDGIHNYFGWPSVARLQDGTLAAVASGFRLAHVCPFGKSVMIRSSDEGKTWSPPEIIIDTPLDDRDSGIVPFGKCGVIVTSFNNTVAFQRGANPDDLCLAESGKLERHQLFGRGAYEGAERSIVAEEHP